MDYLRKRFKYVKKDKIQYSTIFCSILLLICHIWQFIDSGFMIQPGIRIVFYTLLIPGTFLFGREAIGILFLVFAYVATLFITFDNYTAFIILTLFCMVKMNGNNKHDIYLVALIMGLYILCVFVVCELHRKNAAHLLIHFLNCCWIFAFEYIFVRKARPKRVLILDDVQKKILKELASGKMQKEITFVNKNTVTDKIKKAIIENNLLTKEQLLMRYIAEYIDTN